MAVSEVCGWMVSSLTVLETGGAKTMLSDAKSPDAPSASDALGPGATSTLWSALWGKEAAAALMLLRVSAERVLSSA